MRLVHVRQDRNHMATTFELRVSCEPARAQLAQRLLSEAHSLIARLEVALSEFLPESPVFRLNDTAPGARVALGPEAIELLDRSARLSAMTRGTFDSCAKSAPGSLRDLATGAAVAWDRATREAWRLSEGARVGFGAIGKGYALDRVRLLLESHGFRDFLLSAGGSSLVFSGFAGPGDPWKWGWSWKRDAQGDSLGIRFAHAGGEAVAVGVSGTHEKGRHILDPATGAPALGCLSALVAHPSAAEADALSTALFVAGLDETSARLREQLAPVGLATIGLDEVPRWNGIFQKLWGAPATVAQPSMTPVATPTAGASSAIGASAGPVLGALLLTTAAIAAPAATARADAATTAAIPAPAASTSPATISVPTPAVRAATAAAAIPAPAESAAAPVAAAAVPASADASADGAVDLGGMGLNSFTPYVYERSPWWALLPLFMISAVLLHLKKNRRNPVKPKSTKTALSLLAASALLWTQLEARAVDLEPMGKAIAGALGTTKAFGKKIEPVTREDKSGGGTGPIKATVTRLFYSKNASGRADRLAFVVNGLWNGNCSHAWVVALDAASGKLLEVRPQEMGCPHAKPAMSASFLDQYKGKGPADVAKLGSDITTVAKATGTCLLTTQGVEAVYQVYDSQVKGRI